MQLEVAHDMSDAAYDFQRVVWPVIAPSCGGGEFVSTETGKHDPIAKHLDICAGIDGLQIRSDLASVRGLAIRVQWCAESFDTFTIRQTRHTGTQTELEKRRLQLQQLAKGALYPFYTIQAYVTRRRIGTLIKAAVTPTRTLYRYLESHTTQARINSRDDNTFLYVPWSDYLQFTGSCFVFDSTGRRIAP